MTDVRPDADSELPRWSTADVFESFTSRPFVDAMERLALGQPPHRGIGGAASDSFIFQ